MTYNLFDKVISYATFGVGAGLALFSHEPETRNAGLALVVYAAAITNNIGSEEKLDRRIRVLEALLQRETPK